MVMLDLSSLHPEACCCCHCFCRCFPHASSIAAIVMARTMATQLLVPPLRLPPMRLPPACAYLPPFALRFSALSAAQRRLMLWPVNNILGVHSRRCPHCTVLCGGDGITSGGACGARDPKPLRRAVDLGHLAWHRAEAFGLSSRWRRFMAVTKRRDFSSV